MPEQSSEACGLCGQALPQRRWHERLFGRLPVHDRRDKESCKAGLRARLFKAAQ